MIDWLTIEDFLDARTRDRVLSEVTKADAVAAGVYGVAAAIEPRVRNTRLLLVPKDLTVDIGILLHNVQARISAYFDVALTMHEEPQFLRYLPGDFFVPHQDGNTPLIHDDSRHRRVSVVIFLNEASREPSPGSYDGGSFVFHGQYPEWQKRYTVPAVPGSLIAFRSETTHEVTPVTHGTRYSIVSWYR